MTAREFMRKVWQTKSLPPLWMWKPALLRRLAIILFLPAWWLLGALLLAAVQSIAWLVRELPESLAAEWSTACAAWRGHRPKDWF